MLLVVYLCSKVVMSIFKCDAFICKAIYVYMKPGKFFVKAIEIINFCQTNVVKKIYMILWCIRKVTRLKEVILSFFLWTYLHI